MRYTPSNITIFVFLCIALALLFVLKEVQAQEKSPGLRLGNCLPVESAVSLIKDKFREEIVFKGENHLEDMVLISSNPLTKTWTALQTHTEMGGFMCLVAFGTAGLAMPVVDD